MKKKKTILTLVIQYDMPFSFEKARVLIELAKDNGTVKQATVTGMSTKVDVKDW